MTRRKPHKVLVRESTHSRVLEQSRLRLLSVALFFALCFGSISGRLIEMTVSGLRHPAPPVEETAQGQDEDSDDVTQKSTEQRLQRGDIVDRNGVVLATSLMTASAFANPHEIQNPEAAALGLEKALGMPRELLLKRLTSRKSFVWIKRHLCPSEQQAVNNLGIPGIYFLPEEKRAYPYGEEFSHVVGYVGVDNNGLAGIEKTFDSRLTDEAENREPVQLSVDVRVQHILHDEMKKTMEEFRAIGATGAVLDVQSGELLALASLPDFDPHFPARASDAQKFDRAAEGTYEMGSTFKSFTFAAALDNGIAGFKNGYDASGPLHYANFTISDAHSKHRWLSLPEIYAYSSNVGTARMFLDLGIKRQKDFLGKLGMLKPIDIELPEHPQPLYPKDWKEINGITIAYGHGISVTPLHLVRGIATLVNGGMLESLTLLKDGNKGREAGERVVSTNTSLQMRRLMRMVVKHGTAGKADIAGYRVGGKTGTAEKVQGGGYNKDNKMASFIGVFPVDAPRYVVLVMIDEPRGNKATYGFATGGWVSAPAVGKIVERMAPLLSLAPQYNVAGDDAEQFWVDTEKKSSPALPSVRTAAYVRPAAFVTR